MKNFTKKYYVLVSGLATICDFIEITRKQYYQMLDECKRHTSDDLNNVDDYTVTSFSEKHEYERTIATFTYFCNCTTTVTLVESVCKDGYTFKH